MSEGPLSATFRPLVGRPALDVIISVTAPNTLSRGRTEVRSTRRNLGPCLLTLLLTVPTVDITDCADC